MFIEYPIDEFCEELSSKAAVPGGGGASALAGALGAALNSMVANLTVGKKKYADVEEEVLSLREQADALREKMLTLVDADAEAFEPLSKAYGIPKEDPTRTEVMEGALRTACSVPMDIMRCAVEAIKLHERMGKIGSALAISDVGVGVLCCKTALQGASLNVFINTKSMTDRNYAATIEAEAHDLLNQYCPRADACYMAVVERIGG